MSILAVLMSLIIGVANRVIEANQIHLQEANLAILDQILDEFGRQNPLRGRRNLSGDGVITWRGFFGNYPPIDLTAAMPPLNSSPLEEDLDIAGRPLHLRITAPLTDDFPGVLPGAQIMEGQSTSYNLEFDHTESFLFYVNLYSPVSKARLAQLPGKTLSNEDKDWVDVNGDGNGDPGDFDLTELRDVWGNPVLYINDQRDRFNNETGATIPDGRIDNPLVEAANGKPVFVSPGPDGYFTANDIPAPGGEPVPNNPLADNLYSLARGTVDKIDPALTNDGPLTDLLRYDFSNNEWKPQ